MYVARSEKRIFVTCLTRLENVYREEKRKMYHILVVEDDRAILDGVGIYLKNQGYKVFKAQNGKEGLEILANEEIHLAIVDIMMPVMDGITMTIKLREKYDFPVIMLSAKSEEVDKVMGLNIGADDYVTKPFAPMELIARVNSHLRRYSRYLKMAGKKENDHTYVIGGLELNDETKEVRIDGETVTMTPLEFKILALLMKNPGRVFQQKKFMRRYGMKRQSQQRRSWCMSGISGQKSRWIRKIQNI